MNQFAALTRELAALAALEGIGLRPMSSAGALYSKMPLGAQAHALWQLSTLLEVVKRIQARQESLRNSKALAEEFCKTTQMELPADALHKLQGVEFLDIYNADHQLLFANFTFLETVSYSLEDLFCRSWLDLFARDNEGVQKQIFDLCLQILAGSFFGVVEAGHIPVHLIRETSSPLKLTAYLQPKFFAPLRKEGKICGYFCVNNGELLLESSAKRKSWAANQLH